MQLKILLLTSVLVVSVAAGAIGMFVLSSQTSKSSVERLTPVSVRFSDSSWGTHNTTLTVKNSGTTNVTLSNGSLVLISQYFTVESLNSPQRPAQLSVATKTNTYTWNLAGIPSTRIFYKEDVQFLSYQRTVGSTIADVRNSGNTTLYMTPSGWVNNVWTPANVTMTPQRTQLQYPFGANTTVLQPNTVARYTESFTIANLTGTLSIIAIQPTQLTLTTQHGTTFGFAMPTTRNDTFTITNVSSTSPNTVSITVTYGGTNNITGTNRVATLQPILLISFTISTGGVTQLYNLSTRPIQPGQSMTFGINLSGQTWNPASYTVTAYSFYGLTTVSKP